MDQDATWYEGSPRPSALGPGTGHIVLHGNPAHPSPPKKGHSPQFSADVYCCQTVAHLSYCRALIQTVAQKQSKKVIGRNCSGPKMLSAEIDV